MGLVKTMTSGPTTDHSINVETKYTTPNRFLDKHLSHSVSNLVNNPTYTPNNTDILTTNTTENAIITLSAPPPTPPSSTRLKGNGTAPPPTPKWTPSRQATSIYSSTVPKTTSNTVQPTAPITNRAITATTDSSPTIGGIDQNLVIIGCIVGGLLLFVTIAAIILCLKRKRQNKKAPSSKRHPPPSTLNLRSTSNGLSIVESSSPQTTNVNEKLELIPGTPTQSENGGIVTFKNNGEVAFHKDEEEPTEYLEIWNIDELKKQEQEQEREQKQQQQQRHSIHSNQNKEFETRVKVEPEHKVATIQKHTPSPTPSSGSVQEQTIYENVIHRVPSLVNNDKHDIPDSPSAECPEPLPDYDLVPSRQISQNISNLPKEDAQIYEISLRKGSVISGISLGENVYEQYSPASTLSRPRKDSRDLQDSTDGCGRINSGYEHDTEEKSNGFTPSYTTPNSMSTIQETNEKSNRLAITSAEIKTPKPQSSITSENYYEGDEPEPDYALSRDSGIGDSVYDVPTNLIDRLRTQYIINKQPNNRNSDDKLPSAQLGEMNTTGSGYEHDDHHLLETPSQSNYQNTMVKRPDTYLGPDDLELKSPTDEDELLKIYNNYELQAREDASHDPLYETTDESEKTYEIPQRASLQIPNSRDIPRHEKLSSSVPAKVNNFETETHNLAQNNLKSRDTDYMNVASQHYKNSETHDPETDETEYSTPQDIAKSPFFHPIEANERTIGVRTLPPTFKPPPPHLYKPQPQNPRVPGRLSSASISDKDHESNQSLPMQEEEIPNKPTRQQLNVKALTLDISANKNKPPAPRKKPPLPSNKASPLLPGMHTVASSQSLNENYKYKDEEDPSNVYLTPRSIPKDNGQHRPKSKSTRGGPVKVDMGELQNVMKMRGLNQ